MGNSQKKLSNEDRKMLQSTEMVMSTQKVDRHKLQKEYINWKKQFKGGLMTKEDFIRISASFLPDYQKSDEFVDRLFNAFDADRSGKIDFKEFMLAVALASSDNREDKIRFCFRSLDLDNNGYLDREEVTYAVSLIFKHHPGLEKQVSPDVDSPEKVVQQIFKKVDVNDDNQLTADEIINFMHNDEKYFNYLGLHFIFLT
eukprot:TRINITY_DN18953_c0_g1_i1.p1 TRINITY_DN18953_c0_g1~~TRINITY_DN18953_c0_g1_i1.p1  ORF type:complete len:200 (+),score=36.08 TRINITY_DN18953_c0_g1_i1:76-675(+)